jgi:hypothetical protein
VSISDHTPPVLDLLGANPRTVECAAPFRDDGATATDLCDGDLTAAIATTSTVNPRAPGSYRVDFRVQDRAGLAAAASRSVVVADRTAPVVDVEAMRVLSRRDDGYRTFDLSDCATAVDACSGPVAIDQLGDIVAIYSDERERGGPHDPGRDIVIVSNSRFKLRDQSNPLGNGRVYEIEFTVRDRRGNAGVHSCFIGVRAPLHHGLPIDDGRLVTVRPRP